MAGAKDNPKLRHGTRGFHPHRIGFQHEAHAKRVLSSAQRVAACWECALSARCGVVDSSVNKYCFCFCLSCAPPSGCNVYAVARLATRLAGSVGCARSASCSPRGAVSYRQCVQSVVNATISGPCETQLITGKCSKLQQNTLYYFKLRDSKIKFWSLCRAVNNKRNIYGFVFCCPQKFLLIV